MAKKKSEEDDILKQARDAFSLCEEVESHNRLTYVDNYRFAREGIQWPADIVKQREQEGRPCLTINKMPAFIRQVVNDARQNKPSIKVHPADSGADPETAEIYNGLIRQIEYQSNSDVAYDTAVECAVTGGFGYIRVGVDYAYDDAFDMDITIDRVSNPLSVFGDPHSSAADSSDWDTAFVVDKMKKAQFKAQYGDKAQTDWDDDGAWTGVNTTWRDDNTIMVAEYWTREKIDRPIVMLSDGTVLDKGEIEKSPGLQVLLAEGVVQIKGERIAKSCKVTQRFISGIEVLETREWQGKYIPIIPVYGDEFDIEGKRFLRSLVHNGIDAQRMHNYWRTASTELMALAPKVPFIGEEGAFDVDIERWNTANSKSHPFLEVTKGKQIPQRQPMDPGVAVGALQEALNASDDIKAILGIHDASLGARSNETSGRAIMARQREGDVSTFHFIDNMARAIRHTGRVIIDLIPHFYDKPRIVRVIGEDGSERQEKINQPVEVKDDNGKPQTDEMGQPITRVYDLTAGKYDLTVTTGPSYTTRRQESATEMMELLRAFPQAAPVVGDLLAKNLDWPGADEIAERLKKLVPGQEPQIPPEMQKAIEDGKQQIADLTEENQSLKMEKANKEAEIASDERIAMIKIQSDETIAKAKAESDMRVAAFKATLQAQATLASAQNRPAPQRAA